ncbi:MAG: putative porin [Leptospirales bacterium]
MGAPGQARADTEIQASLIFGRNEGEQIFETGSRTPDITGFAGGSRLTYPRNHNFAGLGLALIRSPVEVHLRATTTGWYIDPGGARNEDFTLPPNSTESRSGFDTGDWKFGDSAYTIAGNQNFADARARASLSRYDLEALVRAFPFQLFRPVGARENTGPYLGGALRYSYAKYYVYDAIQYVRTTNGPFLGPIGIGNSLADSVLEFPLGAGYRYRSGDFTYDALFMINSGYNRSRDHHIQRAVNFQIRQGAGDGFFLRLGVDYRIDRDHSITARFFGRRYYSRGFIRTDGGLGQEALLVALAGKQQVWLNTKEAGVEFEITRTLLR